jgi:hypothetical protein
MTSARLLATVLALALPAAPRAAADPAPAPQAAEPAVALPYVHGVGDRFGLRIERERREPGRPSEVRRELADVHVLSPYGRDQLVEVRWQSVEVGGTALVLAPRRPETREALDALGGGRWLLRVDVHGSARELLNGDEVGAAWARARGSALDPDATLAATHDLLDVWNVVYAACGVPLVPSHERVTWVGSDGTTGEGAPPATSAPGRLHDVRVLRLERDAQRVTAWSVHARTRLHEGATASPVDRTAGTRFDLATRRLSGWQLSVRRSPAGGAVERVAFEELAPAAVASSDAAEPAIAAR